MTLKGVFFLLGQYIYGGNCYFVNGPKICRKYNNTLVLIEQIQQNRARLIHTDICGRGHICDALAQQSVCFIKKYYRLLFCSQLKQTSQIF